MNFKDHFSERAEDYARYRPSYPAALYEFLASVTPPRELAWDCGTGSGQAARGLAAHFDRVIATDPSADQIRHAARHVNISYAVAPAEQTEIQSHTADLVTAAQALHWFDMERFYQEARRVLKPGGALAAWCYGACRINPEIDKIVQHYYKDIVGPCWPPERRHIDKQYRDIPFPFAELPVPDFHMKTEWDMNEFKGYLRTWSATRRYQEKNEQDPLQIVHRLLTKTWGDPAARQTIRWPLYVRLGKVTTL